MPSMAFFKQCNVGWENIPRSHNLLSGWANSYRFGVCIRQNMHVYTSLIYICTHTLYIKCLHIHVHISNTLYVNLQQPLHSLHVVFVRWTSTWIVICVQNTAGSECCQFACIAPCQVAQLEGKPNAASNWFTMYYIYINIFSVYSPNWLLGLGWLKVGG